MVFQDNDSGRVRTSSNRPSSMSRRAVASSSRPASSLGPSDSRSSWLLSGSSRLSTSQRVHSGSEQKSSLSRATTSKGVREDPNQSSEHRLRFMEKRKGWLSQLVRERGSTSFWYSPHIPIPMETYFLHAWWGVVTAKLHIFWWKMSIIYILWSYRLSCYVVVEIMKRKIQWYSIQALFLFLKNYVPTYLLNIYSWLAISVPTCLHPIRS